MEIAFAHLADYASISDRGTLSIIGIFQAVTARQMPCIHPRMVVAIGVRISEEDERHEKAIEFSLLDPEGRLMRRAEINLEVKRYDPANAVMNLILPFDLVHFTSAGPYVISIKVGERWAAPLRFSVVHQPNNP